MVFDKQVVNPTLQVETFIAEDSSEKKDNTRLTDRLHLEIFIGKIQRI
ncbi:hypothetical protein [Chengkuizengella sediminis]|nr:hypothetical protein [Chengkuizengella sediminis]NDI33161.1 hypothetical protein [Chengkuizengella sediminis]